MPKFGSVMLVAGIFAHMINVRGTLHVEEQPLHEVSHFISFSEASGEQQCFVALFYGVHFENEIVVRQVILSVVSLLITDC